MGQLLHDECPQCGAPEPVWGYALALDLLVCRECGETAEPEGWEEDEALTLLEERMKRREGMNGGGASGH